MRGRISPVAGSQFKDSRIAGIQSPDETGFVVEDHIIWYVAYLDDVAGESEPAVDRVQF
jgi:hypothetical protein